MKKLTTTAVLLFSACTFMMAQDADFKPAAGSNNLELNFVPLNGKPIQMTYVRYRRFLSEKTAFRLGFGFSYSSNKADSVFASKVPSAPAGTNVTSQYSKNVIGWNIKPGFEKHFGGTNRLSPYIGAELDIAGQSSKETTPTSVSLVSGADQVNITTTSNKSKGGFFRIGVNLVAGFDCYVTKHLYLGTELGFGFQSVSYSDLKVEYTPTPIAPAKNPDPVTQGSEMNIGPNFNSSIRLGFIF